MAAVEVSVLLLGLGLVAVVLFDDVQCLPIVVVVVVAVVVVAAAADDAAAAAAAAALAVVVGTQTVSLEEYTVYLSTALEEDVWVKTAGYCRPFDWDQAKNNRTRT